MPLRFTFSISAPMPGVNTSPRIFLFVRIRNTRRCPAVALVSEFPTANTLHGLRPKHHYGQRVKDLRQPTAAKPSLTALSLAIKSHNRAIFALFPATKGQKRSTPLSLQGLARHLDGYVLCSGHDIILALLSLYR